MDYSALIGCAVVAAFVSGARTNKRLKWVATVICLVFGGCAKRGSASMPVFVSQITNIAVWRIMKFLAAFGGILFAEPTGQRGTGFR